MIKRLEGAQDSVIVCIKLERGNPHIVQVIPEIWPQGKKITRPQMLLAPGSVLKLLSASGSGTTTFERGRGPYGDIRTDLEAMLFKYGGDLVIVCGGTLEQDGPEGRTLSFYNRGGGHRTSLALLRHYVEFKFAWFVCYGDF